jgi:hypothetical protein
VKTVCTTPQEAAYARGEEDNLLSAVKIRGLDYAEADGDQTGNRRGYEKQVGRRPMRVFAGCESFWSPCSPR